MKATAQVLSILQKPALIFLVLATLIIGSFFVLTNIHAQECDPDPTLQAGEAIDKMNKCAIEKNIFDDKLFNFNQLAGTTDSIYTLLTSKSQLHPETDDITAGSGAIAASGKLVAAVYAHPPASGVNYMASKIRNLNPVQPTYAQTGIGFDALQPVQKLWTAMRNIAYVGFVFVFLVIGFMVMFRAHISPQAVATVQDSIPRLVIALALVTFSYAIAGFMIDLMFLFLNVILTALSSQGLIENTDFIFQKSVFSILWESWDGIFVTVADALNNLINGVIELPLGLNKLVGFIGGAIGAIIVGIAIIFIMFRIFFMLLMAYVMIIILTIFAPFYFLVQALPGNNGAKEWFKQIFSHIAVFPVVALMFILAGILGGISELGATGGAALQGTNVGQFPLLAGDIDSGAIGKLIAIGFLLITPSAADLVKGFISGKGAPNVGAGATAALGAAGGFAGGRLASSAPARAFKDLGEERGRRNAEKIVGKAPSWMGGPSNQQGSRSAGEIARGKTA